MMLKDLIIKLQMLESPESEVIFLDVTNDEADDHYDMTFVDVELKNNTVYIKVDAN